MPFDPADKYANQAGAPVTSVAHQPGYSGNNNAAEYVASGLPFSEQVTAPSGNAVLLEFPFVTSEIYITNDSGNPVSFGWTENGVLGTNKHTLVTGDEITLRIRAKNMFFTAESGGDSTISVTAALTMIPHQYFPVLTGSQAHPTTGLPLYVTSSLTSEFGYDGLG